MVLDEQAEIGIATESLADYPELVTMPRYEWQHVCWWCRSTILASVERLGLEALAAEPLITYHPSPVATASTAFAQRKLHPRIALEAIDSGRDHHLCAPGLGIGIVAEMAVREQPTGRTCCRRAGGGHLFGQNLARVAFKRGAYLRNFVLPFAELLSERLDRQLMPRR